MRRLPLSELHLRAVLTGNSLREPRCEGWLRARKHIPSRFGHGAPHLRCRSCVPSEGLCKRRHEEMPTREETHRAPRVAAALGMRKPRLTGGEPLVRRSIRSIREGDTRPRLIEALRRLVGRIKTERVTKQEMT